MNGGWSWKKRCHDSMTENPLIQLQVVNQLAFNYMFVSFVLKTDNIVFSQLRLSTLEIILIFS